MEKIILFDIDGTLFNPEKFLENFYLNLSNKFELENDFKSRIQSIYEEIRNIKGYFIYSLFLEKIAKEFPQINSNELEEIFWDLDSFKKSLFEDSDSLIELSNLATIGIFSKGEEKFQKQKITFLDKVIDNENVYIFPNKIEKTTEVFSKYSNYRIIFVDNDINVINQVKSIMPNIFAILIDRSNNYTDNGSFERINNLNQIKKLI